MATDRLKNLLNELNIDFVKYRYIAGFLSVVTVLLMWVLFGLIGPNWGIDFTGGTEIHVAFQDATQADEVRGAMQKLGMSDDSVYQTGAAEKHQFKIRIQDASFGSERALADIKSRLTGKYGADWISDLSFDAQVGVRVVVTYKGDEVKPGEIQELFNDIPGVSVQAGRDDKQMIVQLPGLTHQVEAQIKEVLPDRKFTVLQVDSVGPKVGADLRVQAFIAVVATMVLVLIYIGFRFDLTFAPGAIVALIHDTSVICGVFVILQKEFSLSIIGALLTVIGYSLNDTVIVYDRLRENREKFPRMEMKNLINLSVNETMTRTISTSGATMLAISPFLFIGGPIVGDFSFAMFLGIIVGTYSTIYIAAPVILIMEEIKPYLARFANVAPVAAASAPAVDPAPTIVKAGTSATVAGPAGGAASPDVAADRPLTESEKRRRERAERERVERERSSRG
jgi:preprotein translocase subunit SecF